MAERQLIVRVIGDDRSLQQAMARDAKAVDKFGRQSQTSLGKFDSAFSKSQRIMAGGFVGGAAVTASLATIQKLSGAASDLQESQSKNQQVFGASSKAIQDWATTTAESFGISQQAALEATGTFGALFTAMGTGEAPAAAMSRRLTELAADLASFNNASIDDTLIAIRSGLVGEIEPLRRYGVQLSAARVEQEAMAATGKTNAKSLTDQEKAAARVAIIFRDTAKAQGDFARTSEGLANQQRILAAKSADLQANLGRLLLPAVTALTSATSDAADAAEGLADGLEALANIRIPEIEIPFVMTIGGDKVGGFLGGAADILKFTPLNPLFGVTVAGEIARQIRDQFAPGSTAEALLAQEFEDSVNTLTTNALRLGGANVKTPKTAVKGFGTGLKPEDLFGPISTEIPNLLREALLDAQASGSDPKIRSALEGIRNWVGNELARPDLKSKDRLALKTIRNTTLSQIEAIDDARADAIRDASDRRSTAAQKAADAARDRREKERQRRIKARAAADAKELARQFRAIGLGPAGEEIIPTPENLLKQFTQLDARLKGSGVKLGSRIAQQFKLAGKILKDPLVKLKPEVREAIRDIFKTARDAFDEGGKEGGPLLRESVRPNQILRGLGLDPDTIRTIRDRLAGATVGAPLPRTATTGGGLIGGQQPVTINTTVTLDGQKVGQSTKRFLLNDRRHNPPQKRGPNTG